MRYVDTKVDGIAVIDILDGDVFKVAGTSCIEHQQLINGEASDVTLKYQVKATSCTYRAQSCLLDSTTSHIDGGRLTEYGAALLLRSSWLERCCAPGTELKARPFSRKSHAWM